MADIISGGSRFTGDKKAPVKKVYVRAKRKKDVRGCKNRPRGKEYKKCDKREGGVKGAEKKRQLYVWCKRFPCRCHNSYRY